MPLACASLRWPRDGAALPGRATVARDGNATGPRWVAPGRPRPVGGHAVGNGVGER